MASPGLGLGEHRGGDMESRRSQREGSQEFIDPWTQEGVGEGRGSTT